LLASLRPPAAAQAPFLALPDELLVSILRRAWAVRRPQFAAAEVCAAAGLAFVCRRVRALLRAQPLPLMLDIRAARLSGAQRRWLLDPAQAGRMEAAFFDFCEAELFAGGDDNVDEDARTGALARLPLLTRLVALHGRTLQRLYGVPLQLVASASHEAQPALDVSAVRLTALGLDCWDVEALLRGDDALGAKCLRLWPERLPSALEELHLLGDDGGWLANLAWAPHPG